MEEASLNPSDYPALDKVLLIESRYSVRVQVRDSLRSTNLFTEIVEPSSLQDGLQSLAQQEFVACVLGSSVKREKLASFLASAMSQNLGGETAFVVLVKDDEEPVEIPGVNGNVRWPCDTGQFSHGLIVAVVEANGESPWAGILFGETPAIPETFEQAEMHAAERFEELKEAEELPKADNQFRLVATAAAAVAPGPGTEAEEMAAPNIQTFFTSNIADLTEIVNAVRSGELGLDKNRQPTPAALFALNAVVSKMFPDRVRSPKIKSFKQYFQEALLIWFVDLVVYSPQVATNNLRTSLVSYFKSGQLG